MVPNNEIEEDARFNRLVEAIKFVYATTFFAESKAYLASIGRPAGEEKMAVIVQEVVGQRAGDRFYPCVSGVARSHNYYPTGHARAEDGVVTLALGLGKTIVDGGLSWSYSPAFPKAPPPFNDLGELLKNTQTLFWAIHMGDPPPYDPIRETEYLVQTGLAEAEADGALRYLVSTYDAGSDRLNPGLDVRGARALTFAPLLGSRLLPFNDLLSRLLRLSENALGTPVEIEFAINLDRQDALPARVGFLQVRPMMAGGERIDVAADDLYDDGVVLASENVLGNGHRSDLEDVVFIRPDVFEPAETPAIAKELEDINRCLVADGRRYLLIGFGRWGTSGNLRLVARHSRCVGPDQWRTSDRRGHPARRATRSQPGLPLFPQSSELPCTLPVRGAPWPAPHRLGLARPAAGRAVDRPHHPRAPAETSRGSGRRRQRTRSDSTPWLKRRATPAPLTS